MNKKTYVLGRELSLLPEDFMTGLNSEDRQMLANQMASLPETTVKILAGMLCE